MQKQSSLQNMDVSIIQNKIDGFIEEATKEERGYLAALTMMHTTIMTLRSERRELMRWMADNAISAGSSRYVAADVLAALFLARETAWAARYDMKRDEFIDSITADDDKE